MKRLVLNMSPKAKRFAHFMLYVVLLAVLMIALVTAKRLPEILGYAGLCIFCIVAMIKDTRRSNFDELNALVQKQCNPKVALEHLAQYPYLLTKEEFSVNSKLLKAYALIDSGEYDKAAEYIGKNKEKAFTTAYSKTIADYLLFQIAVLRNRKGETDDCYAALLERKENFIVDKENGTPGALWYMVEGMRQLIGRQYEQADEEFQKVDTEQLKNNRDKAYYHCGRALACRGKQDDAGYEAHKEQAVALAAEFAAVKAL